MYLKSLLIYPVIFFTGNLLFAQSSSPNLDVLPKVFPKGPNASSLEKFGQYEVSHFTGLPNITIPLYEVTVGDMKIPISISYHTSGNKINKIASWVGLGWSLQSGGRVNRNQVGSDPDEDEHGGLRNPLRTNLNTNVDADLYYINQVCTGEIDTEPDIFSYTLPGKSGKLFL